MYPAVPSNMDLKKLRPFLVHSMQAAQATVDMAGVAWESAKLKILISALIQGLVHVPCFFWGGSATKVCLLAMIPEKGLNGLNGTFSIPERCWICKWRAEHVRRTVASPFAMHES